MNVRMDDYRQPSAYEGIYKYVAPNGYHWMCKGDDFGTVIWGGFDLGNYPYRLVKYEKNEEMVDTNFTNINDTDTDNGKS